MSSKKPIFIANNNGDWWEYLPNEKLYVLDMNNPTDAMQEFFNCECDIEDHDEFVIDAELIQQFGRLVTTPTKEIE